MQLSRRALMSAAAVVTLMVPVSSAAESLQDAIALAYETNPVLQQQRANQRALDESIVQARTGLRPTVGFGATYTYNDGAGSEQGSIFGAGNQNSTARSVSGQFSVDVPLYSGGRTARGIQAAEADILQGREQLRGLEADVLQNVIQSYVDVRRDQEAVRIRTENVGVLRRQLEEAGARFEVGEITRTDVAQAEARLSQSQALLSQAQAQLSVSRAGYAAVVGQVPAGLVQEPALPNLPTTFEQAMDVAEDANPDLRAALFAEEAARARVSQARAAFLPSAALRATYGANAAIEDDFRTASQWFERDVVQAGASVSVPLFTGGLNGSRVRQALERQNAAQIAVEGQRRNVLQAVSQSWANLIAARAASTANEEQVRAARIASEGVRQEAQVGLRTTIDVLDAERDQREAELALINSQRNAYVASAQLLNAMGLLEAQNLVPGVVRYDPARNFQRVENQGTVFYEKALEALDGIASVPVGGPRDTVRDAPIDVQLKQGVRPDTQVPITQPDVRR